MKYLDFINDENIKNSIEGSLEQNILELEKKLRFNIPQALREYLALMGEKTIYRGFDYHGTKDMYELYDWIFELINDYRSKGIKIEEIKLALPFDKFQDTFFYVPIEQENENPPVYAFDINDTPTIRKLNNSFTEFVKERYEKKLNELM